jgi:hypothetical protein
MSRPSDRSTEPASGLSVHSGHDHSAKNTGGTRYARFTNNQH